jgi:MFS family permease
VAVQAAAPSSRLLRLYPALAVSSFRLLWLGMVPASLAWQMSVVATGYAAFQLTGSAVWLGLVSSSIGLPMLTFGLVGGVAADRLPRRTVLLCTQTTLGAAPAVLALLTFTGHLAAWHLVALGVVQGIAFAFNMPARQAYMAEIVGPDLVRSAISLNNAGQNFCRVAGPAIAGVLLAQDWIGVGGVFLLMTAMYALVLSTLLRLPADDRTASRSTAKGNGWTEMLEGLRYIRGSPTLLALLGLAFAPLFFGMPYQTLMPVFAERVFDSGASGLGTLLAANGLGALVGSLAIASLASAARPSLLQLGFGVGFGLALVAFALAPSFVVAAGLLGLVGCASAAYSALNNTLIMSNTEPRLYGRVMSVYLMTFGLQPLATLPASWSAEHLGAPATVVGTGLIVTTVVAGVAAFYPAYRRIS